MIRTMIHTKNNMRRSNIPNTKVSQKIMTTRARKVNIPVRKVNIPARKRPPTRTTMDISEHLHQRRTEEKHHLIYTSGLPCVS